MKIVDFRPVRREVDFYMEELMERNQFIQSSIISDIPDGVLVLRFDGVIELVNDAALSILEMPGENLLGKSFAPVFIGTEENDDFIQCVLDAVYDHGRRKESYVSYKSVSRNKQLRVVSSCLRENGEIIGVILILSDITELSEMRDAVRAMEKIEKLNHQLELRNRVLQETFGRYLSDEIVQEILDSPGGWQLGGQRRQLSIMMTDLRGFTALSEQMPAQGLITMLNRYFSEMYAEIERNHGTLIEFMGDGMLVIFGAPIRCENHAAAAVAAALGMQKRMETVNRWNAEHGYPLLSMGIGINTDEVILGNIGSQKRTKYGVLGPAVNLAGRIESYTTGGQILVSPGTRSAIDSELDIRQTLAVSPKGVHGEILLSDVVGLGSPYSIHLCKTENALRMLSRPSALRFGLVVDKFVSSQELEGQILAVSEQEALLKTKASLNIFDNLCLDIGDKLYAKLTGQEHGNWRLSFTGKPHCFSAWMKGLEYEP